MSEHLAATALNPKFEAVLRECLDGLIHPDMPRVADDWIPLVEDAGHPARVSLLTRCRPLADDALSTTSSAKDAAS